MSDRNKYSRGTKRNPGVTHIVTLEHGQVHGVVCLLRNVQHHLQSVLVVGKMNQIESKVQSKVVSVIKYVIFFPAKQEITNCQIHPSSLKIHYYHYHYHVYHHYHHHHHHHFTLISPCPSRFITTITTFIITITTTTNIIITTATKIITITTLP